MKIPEQSGKDVSVGDADKDGYHTYWHKDFPQVQIKIKEPPNFGIVFYLLKKLTEIRADLDPKHPFNINKGGNK
jgi:hypothetical protein